MTKEQLTQQAEDNVNAWKARFKLSKDQALLTQSLYKEGYKQALQAVVAHLQTMDFPKTFMTDFQGKIAATEISNHFKELLPSSQPIPNL